MLAVRLTTQMEQIVLFLVVLKKHLKQLQNQPAIQCPLSEFLTKKPPQVYENQPVIQTPPHSHIFSKPMIVLITYPHPYLSQDLF